MKAKFIKRMLEQAQELERLRQGFEDQEDWALEVVRSEHDADNEVARRERIGLRGYDEGELR